MNDSEAGGLRARLRSLTRSDASVAAVEERTRSAELGGTPCGQLQGRRQVQLVGALRSVSLRPRAGVPALEAELADGSGTVTLIFLGRREIPGISPGRWMRVQGLVACDEGRKTIYNPRYELLQAGPRA